jgi:hypothetical protein
MAEADQFAVDTPITPCRVLPARHTTSRATAEAVGGRPRRR